MMDDAIRCFQLGELDIRTSRVTGKRSYYAYTADHCRSRGECGPSGLHWEQGPTTRWEHFKRYVHDYIFGHKVIFEPDPESVSDRSM